MGVVHDGYGHIVDPFVVVDPRVEDRIAQGDEDEEDEDAFVLEGVLHLQPPDIAGVMDGFGHRMEDSFDSFHAFRVCKRIRAWPSSCGTSSATGAGRTAPGPLCGRSRRRAGSP